MMFEYRLAILTKEYANNLRAEKAVREAEAAIRGRGSRKGKGKKT